MTEKDSLMLCYCLIITAVDNVFIANYKFRKYTVSLIHNGLSDHDAQLLTIKDINLQTVKHHSSSIRNINKYSLENFKVRLSYESWDSIFSNNDNMDVDSLFNIFLNSYLRIVYTSFPLRKIFEKGKIRQWITIGIKRPVTMKDSVTCLVRAVMIST
jgi:hypothetical protein